MKNKQLAKCFIRSSPRGNSMKYLAKTLKKITISLFWLIIYFFTNSVICPAQSHRYIFNPLGTPNPSPTRETIIISYRVDNSIIGQCILNYENNFRCELDVLPRIYKIMSTDYENGKAYCTTTDGQILNPQDVTFLSGCATAFDCHWYPGGLNTTVSSAISTIKTYTEADVSGGDFPTTIVPSDFEFGLGATSDGYTGTYKL
jgi:hypothetical protein